MTSGSAHSGDIHGRPSGRRPPLPKADRLARDPSARLRRLQAALREVMRRPASDPFPSGGPAELAAVPDDALDALSESDRAHADLPVEVPDGLDDLPEYIAYRDTGCHVAPACLSCPLPRCIFDAPPDAARLARTRRDRRIRSLARQGWSADRIAVRFNLSPGQVRRIRGPAPKQNRPPR